jgi:regulator of replication initiation timing
MQGYNNTAAIDQNRPNTTSRARRNVAHLDAGQLERKRAVDRDAQRAFRQRTRFQIEQLEQQIAQLKSQGTSTVSKSVIEERNTLRCENERLKARIVSIESALQTVLNLCHHEKPNERLRHEAFTNSEEPCLQRETPISKGILNAESMQQCIIRQPTPRTCASLQSIVVRYTLRCRNSNS